MSDIRHYNRKPVRDAEFIKPPNMLRAKVGKGGMNEQILERAQKLLENHTEDFRPLAEIYLDQLKDGIEYAREHSTSSQDQDEIIAGLIFPTVQLKANGTMFHYPLVTRIADRFVQFLEVIVRVEEETLKIADAFHQTIKIVVHGQIKGQGGEHGEALVDELNKACMRYFEKHKDTVDFDKNKRP